MEGKADMAWGGVRGERGREELCLTDGGDGKGKSEGATAWSISGHAG